MYSKPYNRSIKKRMEIEMEERMINYLQGMLDDYKVEEQKYGLEDRIVRKKFDSMIACKEMVEVLIGEPVNLTLEGKVTVGF